MAEGLHVGAQLYVSLHGRVVADVAVGRASAAGSMRTDTLMLWLSSTKPIVAVAIAQLWERGKLGLDDAVSRHMPEFAAEGKEGVTIRHLLTHTGGFRPSASNWSKGSWDQIIARIAGAPLESGWVPGRKAGYHVASSWFILGELIRRIDGRPFDEYVRSEIFLPLGMIDSWVGMSPTAHRAYGERIGLMHDTARGEARPHKDWDTPEAAAACRPGGNGRGPIRELGRFYEMMLAHGRMGHARIISPQTVEAMTARHRVGMLDETFRHVIDWGLGFMINSAMYGWETAPYGFGPHASPRAFGHGGAQSSGAYADPEHQLAVAYVFNGTPGERRHHERIRPLNAAIYEDMGLVR